MRITYGRLAIAVFATMSVFVSAAYADDDRRFYSGRHDDYYDGHGFYDDHGQKVHDESVQLGPRPFYLVQGMDEGKLKDRLMRCENGPFYRTAFSIGHRGAALQFPEHTKEAYEAGARMGAGIVECDVTFTNDGDLVSSRRVRPAYDNQYRGHSLECEVQRAVSRAGVESQVLHERSIARRVQDAAG